VMVILPIPSAGSGMYISLVTVGVGGSCTVHIPRMVISTIMALRVVANRSFIPKLDVFFVLFSVRRRVTRFCLNSTYTRYTFPSRKVKTKSKLRLNTHILEIQVARDGFPIKSNVERFSTVPPRAINITINGCVARTISCFPNSASKIIIIT